ncbi:RIP metalloprotease RseP [Leptolyngbya sp. FACHB-261]|uniref:RIP metalloprotease RseP n=1 Tax=Leptolyngbya sp. FACHB-261 TaxID=2692806 RepID=UPI001683A72D|nr:RIP metalloprotease RseP [Leptolyngbya sp. FACHB-261]MBD2101420.1 RIP metalloprotease RseP [Leptolyngbya sp. FACHB-261]
MFILAAIGVLALLIVVHELGHFLAARWQGIHVNRFSIGFGPILWKYQGQQTEYALRGFPLGGYVGFPDDDPDSTIPANDPDLLKNRPILDRAIVISAGVISNLLFAYIVLVTQVGFVGVPVGVQQPGITIQQTTVSAETPSAAQQAGLKAGDIVLQAGDQELGASEQVSQQFTQLIQSNGEKPLPLRVKRGDEVLDLTVQPQRVDDTYRIGVVIGPNAIVQYRRPQSLGELFSQATNEYQRQTLGILQGLGRLVSNFSETADQLGGPVRIVADASRYAQNDWRTLFTITAAISINLAIINILPLPALDGGQLSFLLVEAVRGKPLPETIQAGVMQTGLVMLLGLGVFLIIKDTLMLIAPGSVP